MPQIIPNQKFIHDRVVYEEGKAVEVTPELAFYFKQVGWVGPKAPPTGEAVDLGVNDAISGQRSEAK